MRKAFTADVGAGKTLVVADYGQLELRILAHMANCKSMIEVGGRVGGCMEGGLRGYGSTMGSGAEARRAGPGWCGMMRSCVYRIAA